MMACLLGSAACLAQSSPTGERKGVRRGNRDFRKEQWQDAEINYKKALVADSTSASADYNLANTYYRMENYSEADRYLRAGADSLAKGNHGADLFHNQGNVMLKQRNWQGAIEAYKNALRRNPGDMETKSNLAYAQKMLENEQQNGGGGGNNDQNQDQQDQNQDQNNDQDQNKDQNQDQNNDQNQNDDQQNDNQDQQDQQDQQNQQDRQDQGQQPKITPQAAQQMLQAIQARVKDTQDKVKKEKAAKLKSKQKEKNW